MLTIVSAHSPAYSDPDHQHVSLMVKFEEFDEELPFNATPHDSMPYGVELYNRAKAGEFGEIQPCPYTETPQPTSTGTQQA